MSASQTLVMNTRLILGTEKTATAAAIATLDPAEILELQAQVTLFEAVANRAADLESDGVKYSAETDRRLIRGRISTLLGLASVANGPVVLTATPFDADLLLGISDESTWVQSLANLDA